MSLWSCRTSLIQGAILSIADKVYGIHYGGFPCSILSKDHHGRFTCVEIYLDWTRRPAKAVQGQFFDPLCHFQPPWPSQSSARPSVSSLRRKACQRRAFPLTLPIYLHQ